MPTKDSTNAESWEFIDSNMIQLIFKCINIFVNKYAENLSNVRVACKTGSLENWALVEFLYMCWLHRY